MGQATPHPGPTVNAPTGNPQQAQARFHRFWRESGPRPFLSRPFVSSAAELSAWSGRDLDILIAPPDGKYADSKQEYEMLVKLYCIPDQFVLERERNVMHSLGRQVDGDGSETLWMHFLSEVPSTDPGNCQPQWLKWGFILKWQPAAPGSTTYSVSLIAFEPPVETLKQLVQLWQSSNWTDVAIDPYILVNVALASWHERIDQVAWEVNGMVRADEEDIFRRSQTLRSSKTTSSELNLHRLHTSAKNAIFMVESLDAVIRSVDLALLGHDVLARVPGCKDNVWENTNRRLQHTGELFHSTKLRTVSVQARIKNTVDLAFHINTVHDSQVNIDNSQSVRIISIVGMVFIPFSAVSSIFGTQFFSAAPSPSEEGASASHMDVNPDFWILWAIALPLTFFIIGMWRWNEYRNSKYSGEVYLWRVFWAWLQRSRGSRRRDPGGLKDASKIV
ncbi:hypothetical protein QBC44DRAFT_248725 [Cladorrhinum sp. PSN332]|nr:hypothetical protein QBC44DRAFT_248725 [Cladorrhinum sp. PSN332]